MLHHGPSFTHTHTHTRIGGSLLLLALPSVPSLAENFCCKWDASYPSGVLAERQRMMAAAAETHLKSLS